MQKEGRRAPTSLKTSDTKDKIWCQLLESSQCPSRGQKNQVYYYSTPGHTLLDPLLSLLRIRVSRCTKAAFVPGHERAKQRVFPDLADRLLVALGHVWARVELGPVDLGDAC